MHRTARIVIVASLVAACGSAPRGRVAAAIDRDDLEGALEAYETLRAVEGSDPPLLGRVAALLLEREARSEDAAVRRAAVQQLALAGTPGAPALRRLAALPGVPPTRLEALEALARRGDEDARLALRALADHEDASVSAYAVLGMDPTLDRALLLERAHDASARVRREALDRLRLAADDAAVRDALVETARVDPDGSVRAAAVRALGRAGSEAVPMLRERLGDPDPSVRMAAVTALMEADPERGRLALGAMLDIAPDVAGIEAARLLAQAGEGPEGLAGVDAAHAFLRRALRSSEPSLRSQAGVAIASLPVDREPPLGALREALTAERNAEVRLSLARALFRHDASGARSVLVALMREAEGMVRVQAAALLAPARDGEARQALESVVSSDQPSIVRRTAARALARDALAPDLVRDVLRDDDALVRIYAAGGILAASAVAG